MPWLFLCRLGDGCLRGLSSEIDEFEQILVVGYSGGALTVLLPFKHGISVKLELKYRRNEGTRCFVVHCFQSAEMLLFGVVQLMPLFTGAFWCLL